MSNDEISCIECGILGIKHKYLKLCSNCYKNKRKADWTLNELKRQEKDSNRIVSRRKYCTEKYYSTYRKDRLVNKKCIDCGEGALKGSHFSQCKLCSSLRASKKKVIYQMDRKKNHLPTKIRNALSGRLKDFLQSKNKRKDESIVSFLGCSIPDFIIHIEGLFLPGMTWDNYGFYGWHFDHIKPLSEFNVASEEELIKMSHYTNLQPLWAEDNFKKSNKYEQ